MRRTLVGLVVDDPSNPFIGELIRGAQAIANEAGIGLMVSIVDWSADSPLPVINMLRSAGVDGCIAFVPPRQTEELLSLPVDQPVVLINSFSSDLPRGMAGLSIDLLEVGRRAAEYLHDIERTNLAIIHSSRDTDGRYLGFMGRAAELGIPVRPEAQARVEPNTAGGYSGATQLLSAGLEIDGLFTYNDLMAVGALEALADLGVEVPHQCAVLGCDGIAIAPMVRPPLSTLDLDPAGVGQAAVELLVDVLDGRVDVSVGGLAPRVTKPKLIVRESTDVGLAEISNRLPTLKRMTGGIVHDFNNALTVLSGANELIQLRYDDGEQSELFHAADNALNRATVLARQLTTLFNRPQPGEPLPVDRFLGEMVLDLAPAVPSHVLRLVPSGRAVTVRVDQAMLESTMLNLVINAGAAAPRGTITIVDGPVKALPTTLPGRAEDYWSIDVIDDGPGVPIAYRERIFDPFFSLTAGGSGLGLSLARSFLDFSGGAIELLEGPEDGARFRLYLPLTEDDPGGGGSGPSVALGAMTVVLVEDNESVQQVLVEMIETLGATCIAHSNAFDMLDGLDNGEDFDVLITDLSMPGPSGAELAQRVRAQRPWSPVIYLTGNSEPFADVLGLNERTVLLQKPVNLATLRAALHRFAVGPGETFGSGGSTGR